MLGPDHLSSLEPNDLCEMVRQIRAIEVALGDGIKAPFKSEWDTRQASRQQVVVTRDIKAGEIFSRENLSTKRCGEGTPAALLWETIGLQAIRDYQSGDVVEK